MDQLRPLPPAVLRYLHDDLRIVLTYHSNAIEGNTLDLNETRLVIEEGLTVGFVTPYANTSKRPTTLRPSTTSKSWSRAAAHLTRPASWILHRLVMVGLIPEPERCEVSAYTFAARRGPRRHRLWCLSYSTSGYPG